ncbi:MAG: methane/ammonia monooxygenase subunit [Actinomycetota bacterium]|nr:methane/ammonia monooxygenase subunit [Actinomycetota bacterium]
MIQAPERLEQKPANPFATRPGTDGTTLTGFGDSTLKPPKDELRQAWALLGWGMLVAVTIAVAYRIYQQAFAWSKGTDAASADFAHYWMSLMVIELIGLGVFAAVWYARILRIKPLEPATPEQEAGRIMKLWAGLAVLSFILYMEASYTAEQDGSWHMVTIRDTHFTPSHISIFYFWFPLGAIVTVGLFLYARRTLPGLFKNKGIPLSFTLLIMATLLEVSQVAFNEFGHTLWIPEETFANPFHWSFVFFVWLAGGIFGIWFQTAMRLVELGKPKATTSVTSGGGGEPALAGATSAPAWPTTSNPAWPT